MRSETPIVHVAFGTDKFSQALARLRRSARRFGVRDVRLYGVDHPAVLQAAGQNPKIMKQSRGAGYWLWKPYILLDTLRTVEEGTVVVYTDAAQRYIADPSPLIDLTASRDVILFHNDKDYLQRHWTKRDCFVLMRADEPLYWDARQLDASIQIYRAGPKAQSFLLEMQDTMRDPRILCDEANMSGPNLDGFVDHRHDQSILTILAIKYKIETFPCPKVVVNRRLSESDDRAARKAQVLRAKGPLIFEHHRRKNERPRIYWRRLFDDFLGR